MVSPSRNALLLAVGSWLHPQGIERKIMGKSSLDTPGHHGYHNPVRSSHETHMVLKSKNDIWPLGEVHDLEVRGFGATFWSFPDRKNNGQWGVIEIFFQSVTSCLFWILICRPNGNLMGFNVDLSRFIDILLFERGSSFFSRFEGMNLIFQHLPISVPEPPTALGTFPLKRLPWSLKVSKQHSMGSTRMEYGNVWDITRIYMR